MRWQDGDDRCDILVVKVVQGFSEATFRILPALSCGVQIEGLAVAHERRLTCRVEVEIHVGHHELTDGLVNWKPGADESEVGFAHCSPVAILLIDGYSPM